MRGLLLLVFLFAGICPHFARAQGSMLPFVSGVENYAALGVGVINAYPGSDDYIVGGLPAARFSLGAYRNLQILGTYVALNAIEHPHFRFGPVVNYRFGRQDADDPVVAKVHEIHDAVELGVTVGGEWVIDRDIRHRFYMGADILADATGAYDGMFVNLFARYWRPVSRAIDIGIGVSGTYGSGAYMDTFFGVTATDSAQSGLPVYSADAGIQSVQFLPMLMVHLSESWHVGVGGRYSRLVSSAADSPIVRDRGSANQFVAGAGIAYAW
jgi:MipA family protein